ncbi:MAG: filamentous hemagglutinin N-terminal domain-containing protein, partial [Sedimentisphaerales bacterium]|nr:filamentous hemagglutinin N-terminal domain-containing protein [Sedimentisphaerales bacterium]
MKTIKRISKKYAIKKAVICLMVWCMLFNVPMLAFGTPANPQVVSGSAGVTIGNTTTVTMDSAKAVINWDSLNTISTQVLQFQKASGDFAVLNRVVSGGATQFNGTLLGNQGNIFIVNTRGIVFGPKAV